MNLERRLDIIADGNTDGGNRLNPAELVEDAKGFIDRYARSEYGDGRRPEDARPEDRPVIHYDITAIQGRPVIAMQTFAADKDSRYGQLTKVVEAIVMYAHAKGFNLNVETQKSFQDIVNGTMPVSDMYRSLAPMHFDGIF